MTASQMVAALKKEGIKPVEYKGWTTHNRNHKGPFNDVVGVVVHHTAGSNSLELCHDGTSALPGPLCHAHLAKDGTLTLLSAGRANHAGNFTPNAHAAVLTESNTHPRPSGAETVDGNAHYYGVEIENLGNGKDPYPSSQYQSAVKWAAAICRAHGWTANSVIGHKEGTTRKIDPSFDMEIFRADVAKRLALDPTPTPEETAPVEGAMATIGRYDEDDQVLTPRVTRTLNIEGVDLIQNARSYVATVMLELTGAPFGSVLEGRWIHVHTDGTTWQSGVIERTSTGTLGSGTSSNLDFPHMGSVGVTEKVRFEVTYYPVDPEDTRTATVVTSRVRGLYWS